MNIRNRVIETYIPGYYITTRVHVHGGIFSCGHWEDKKVHVPSRYEEKTVLEYLNPETTKWEPIPRICEYIAINEPAST